MNTPKPDIELVDCGQVSQRTQGIPMLLLYELGTPPYNKLFVL